MSAPKTYDKVVLDEGGFKVEMSNTGTKPKYHPFELNIRNPNRNVVECVFEGCDTNTKDKTGVCSKHGLDKHNVRRKRHPVDWIGSLIASKSNSTPLTPSHAYMMETLFSWVIKGHSGTLLKSGHGEKEKTKILDSVITEFLDRLIEIPDATTLQNNLEGKSTEGVHPDKLINLIRKIVDRYIPIDEFSSEYAISMKKGLPNIQIRVAFALMLSGLVCEQVNRGDIWLCINYPEYGKSRYGNAYMPLVYYLLRKYTKASPAQAQKCLKG